MLLLLEGCDGVVTGSQIMSGNFLLPLGDVLHPFGQAPLEVVKLVKLFSRDRDALVDAIERNKPVAMTSAKSALAHLFSQAVDEQSLDIFFALCPACLQDDAVTSFIVREVVRRAPLRNGFASDATKRNWLDRLGTLQAWPASALRLISTCDAYQGHLGRSFLQSLAKVSELTWQSQPGLARFALLTVLRHLRWRREAHRDIEDLGMEESLRAILASHRDGQIMLRLLIRLDELPLRESSTDCPWLALPPRNRWLWHELVRDVLSTTAHLEEAFVEYVLSWCPRDVVGDIEPLIMEILEGRPDTSLLFEMAQASSPVASLRAACLKRFQDRHGRGHRKPSPAALVR